MNSMTGKKTQQVVGWDITIPKDKYPTWQHLGQKLNGWCRKWVFQEEKGHETGYEHWQCRVYTIHKYTLAGMKTKLAMGDGPMHAIGGHWSITSGGVHQNNQFNYVMKEDSRVDGPWRDSDYEDPPLLTRQLQNFHNKIEQTGFYPWQQTLLDIIEVDDDRYINLILDVHGNIGKSIMEEYIEYHQLGFGIPCMRVMEDIMQFCFSFRAQKTYLIDMPRGMKKDKLGDFYAGLECLKNGVVYDKRYTGKKRRFDRPQVVVFTNTLPELSLMSMDRWRIYEMQPDRRTMVLKPTASFAGASL